MCILSKPNIKTKTVIVISKKQLLYANRLKTQYEYVETDEDKERAPTMVFSFNVPEGTARPIPTIYKKKHLKDLITLHRETLVENRVIDTFEFEAEACIMEEYSKKSPVQVYHKEGYEITVGPREDMYKKAIIGASAAEIDCLSTLIDESIDHGTHAVYAKPESADNAWTAIGLTYLDDYGRQLTFDNSDDILIPLCHENMGHRYNRYTFDQLIVLDGDVHKGRKFTAGNILKDIDAATRMNRDRERRFIASPDSFTPVEVEPADGYAGKIQKNLYCNEKIVATSDSVFVKFDARSQNMNVCVGDLYIDAAVAPMFSPSPFGLVD